MTLLYKPSKIRSHLDPEQKERYIARPTKRIIVDQDAIGELLAMRSTVSPEDVSLAFADIGVQLEALKRDALFDQNLGRGQPHRAGPDQGKSVG